MMKKIKFILGAMVLALGFFFCFCLVSVSAEEGTETAEEPKVEETTTETQEQDEEVVIDDAVVNLFLNHLKDLKWEEAEAIFGWIIAYLALNYTTILGFVIALVLKKLQAEKNSKAFQEALAKLSLENQEKANKLIEDFENQLLELKTSIEEQNKKYQDELDARASDQTKDIAEALKGISENLK